MVAGELGCGGHDETQTKISAHEAQVLGAEAAAADSDPLAVMEFVGGEEAGLARVEEYIWENEENLEVYFDTRNGFLGRDFSRCLQMLLRDTMHKSENSLQLRPSILLLLCPLLAACTYFRVNQQIFAVARPRMPIPPVVLLGDHKVGERRGLVPGGKEGERRSAWRARGLD